MFDTIEPIISALPNVHAESVTDFIKNQSLDLQETAKIAFGAVLTIAAILGLIYSKGKVAKIIILIVALAIGAWLVLSDGWSWGKDKFDGQVTSAPSSYMEPFEPAEF